MKSSPSLHERGRKEVACSICRRWAGRPSRRAQTRELGLQPAAPRAEWPRLQRLHLLPSIPIHHHPPSLSSAPPSMVSPPPTASAPPTMLTGAPISGSLSAILRYPFCPSPSIQPHESCADTLVPSLALPCHCVPVQTGAQFFACPSTGECSWEPPVGNFVYVQAYSLILFRPNLHFLSLVYHPVNPVNGGS